MSQQRQSPWRLARWLLLVGLSALLVACAGTSNQTKPTELKSNPELLTPRLAWRAQIGSIDFPLNLKVNDNNLTLASSDGSVLALAADTGLELWRANLATPLAAGVGSDGHITAVITRNNQLVSLASGRELWRQNLGAQAYTAPLVAGGRIFAATADRTVAAFDAQNGRKLWTQQRTGEPLVLRQAGILLAVGDTLVLGSSGRLLGLNPNSGSVRWESPIATPRGSNDVERLVDLVAPASRQADTLCVRAFQAAIACVNPAQGQLLWTQAAAGAQGLSGDADTVVGTEADGKVIAWRRNNGDRIWTAEQLKYRGLSSALTLGNAIAVGDSEGWVHWLSKQDGSTLTRMATDGSAIVASPVLAGNTLVVVTRRGAIFGFQTP
ncbi:MAG: outer membrane protein assembly factor BamB [Burkholderiaceae bacterium]